MNEWLDLFIGGEDNEVFGLEEGVEFGFIWAFEGDAKQIVRIGWLFAVFKLRELIFWVGLAVFRKSEAFLPVGVTFGGEVDGVRSEFEFERLGGVVRWKAGKLVELQEGEQGREEGNKPCESG